MPALNRVLIANRAEIAIRVIRACRDLGIEPIAVYSEADEHCLHTELAASAIPIGPAPARQSYLRVDGIIDAARKADAQAVHPGYGFLAEDPRLPEACAAAGLAFVGPPADVMARIGDKVAARAAAVHAGAPIVPGSDGRIDDADAALEICEEIGFPVFLKAAAGGGGRGIRVVERAEDLAGAFGQASAEADAAFGDGGLFVEKRIEGPRHVEVQVLADAHGHVVHLYERDCSTQRRKQKLIEEAPAPGISPETRERLCAAAVALTREVGYVGAGTCEFLVDAEAEGFYFIEMNARIQVEHGITELVTGLDLVAEQLRIAAGDPISFAQGDVEVRGAAVEFRINAEDPDQGFVPSPGDITEWHVPAGPGIRFDTAFEAGRAVVPFYDSLLAKLMTWGNDREQMLARGARALGELHVEGVSTTSALHRRLLSWAPLVNGCVTTESLEEFLSSESSLASRTSSNP